VAGILRARILTEFIQWQTSNQPGKGPARRPKRAFTRWACARKGDKDAAASAYKEAVPVIDSMITKGVVNKNKAARHKSRLNKMVKALAA
jgi:ribosomal protein S20